MLTDVFKEKVLPLAPGANVIRSHQPPVLGAVLLGFMAAGLDPKPELRERIIQTMPHVPVEEA
jgi:hypothetical protein